ncbi:MAG: hypothetical protein C0600_03075 [Ignavibacteria bacterium]|nr:MAG: hypothetical protein C0600_03075 [Ignavibacteria bacterium]
MAVLLLFGIFDILNLGSLVDLLSKFWPLIVIATGVGKIVSGGSRRFSEGLVMIAVGVVLQIVMLGIVTGDLFRYWPVLLMIMGLWMIFVQPKNSVIERTISDSEIDISQTVRGSLLTVDSPAFTGGRFRTLLSAVECDFGPCTSAARFMKLRCSIRASRICLYLPEDWRVEDALHQSGASVKDKRALGNPPDGTDAPELQLEGTIQFSSLMICDIEDSEENEGEGN